MLRNNGIVASLISTVTLLGCGEVDELNPPQETVVQVIPERKPEPSVSELMESLVIDERVYMTTENAPVGTQERTAVLRFFDLFLRGRYQEFRTMLSFEDQPLWDLMIETQNIDEILSNIEEVELVSGSSPTGEPAILAMFVYRGVDMYQLWNYDTKDEGEMFHAVPSPPGVVYRLTGPVSGYIDQWYAILDEQMRLANLPDEEIRLDVNLDEESEDESATPSAPVAAPSPGGDAPIRRHRPGKPRRPPGVPG